jgi:hypothetical protein
VFDDPLVTGFLTTIYFQDAFDRDLTMEDERLQELDLARQNSGTNRG